MNIKNYKCEVCKSPNVEEHHPDHSKPGIVMWLCKQHHEEQHKKEGKWGLPKK